MLAVQSPSAPAVDGNLNEYDLSTSIGLSVSGSSDNSASFSTQWDANYFYVGISVQDGSLQNDSPKNWKDDGIEVYIDANNNKGTTYDSFDRQFVLGWSDSTISEQNGNTAGVLFAQSSVSGGYAIELAIPWSNLGVSPTTDLVMGFDIGVNDDDNGAGRDGQLLWSGTVDNYRNTSAFGKVVLLDSQDDTAQGAYQGPHTIPGSIEGEHYDVGGEGVAYHDDDSKSGDLTFRPDDKVDVVDQASASNGYSVGFSRTGEWLEYTVDVNPGTYEMILSYSSGKSVRGDVEVSLEGEVLGTFSGLVRTGWSTFTTDTLRDVVLDRGNNQVLRLSYVNGKDVNIDAISFVAVDPPAPSVPLGQTIWLRSLRSDRYVTANLDQAGSPLTASWATSVQAWERFEVVSAQQGRVALRSAANGQYVAVENNRADKLLRAQPDGRGGLGTVRVGEQQRWHRIAAGPSERSVR